MQDYIESYMRMASSFEMEVYQSGIIHAELIKLAIATQRSNMEATSGSLYWHFNDMWPGITCSTVDYYGRWKPAQYAAKRYFKQVSAFFIAKQLMG
jgi:beta-mannosidase